MLPHLSEAQQRALRIADNKIALGAGWDLDLLKLELGELAVLDVDLDLALTGFSSGEIDVILKGPADPEDEVIPAVPATPRTRPGDIWILGEHRVGCGDGRDLGLPAGGGRRRRQDRRRLPRSALQRPDQRPCQCQGPAPRVRHGLGRDERGGVPELPRPRRSAPAPGCRATARCTSSAWTGGTSRTWRRSAVRSTASS